MAKFDLLKLINDTILKFEDLGWVKRTPAFLYNYEEDYPYFNELEENHDVVQDECKMLLEHYSDLKDVDGVAGSRTDGGIHAIKWKSFMFMAGEFIEENCELAPKTSAILKRIPHIRNVFFSILAPQQYITPHRGYYQGFLRYHLGVIIPENNVHENCWLRINDDLSDNKEYDKESIDKGEKYYWKNGKGILFNDNYIHDAANYTDEIRVVLWIDVERKFPQPLHWLLRTFEYFGYKTKQVRSIATKNKVNFTDKS